MLTNLQRKAAAADQMFAALIGHMNDAMRVESRVYDKEMEMPKWAS